MMCIYKPLISGTVRVCFIYIPPELAASPSLLCAAGSLTCRLYTRGALCAAGSLTCRLYTRGALCAAGSLTCRLYTRGLVVYVCRGFVWWVHLMIRGIDV